MWFSVPVFIGLTYTTSMGARIDFNAINGGVVQSQESPKTSANWKWHQFDSKHNCCAYYNELSHQKETSPPSSPTFLMLNILFLLLGKIIKTRAEAYKFQLLQHGTQVGCDKAMINIENEEVEMFGLMPKVVKKNAAFKWLRWENWRIYFWCIFRAKVFNSLSR